MDIHATGAIAPWRTSDKTYRVEHRRLYHPTWTRFKAIVTYPSNGEDGIGGSYDTEAAARAFALQRSGRRDKSENEYRVTTRTHVIGYYAQGRDLTHPTLRRVVSV